jgi:beta-glucosidase
MRLLGFERVELAAGESRTVTIIAEPRVLARYEQDASQWHISGGSCRVALAKSASDFALTADTTLDERRFGH